MRSLILSTATRLLLPLILLLSLYLLLRGHNEPGGGFVGGLVAAAALSLYAFAYGVRVAESTLRLNTLSLIGAGLLLSAGSTIIPLFFGEPFFTNIWFPYELPVVGKVGISTLFDTGVYLLVIGSTLTIIFAMAQAEEE